MTIRNVEGSSPGAAQDTAKRVREDASASTGAAERRATTAGAGEKQSAAVRATKIVSLPEFPTYELSFRMDQERGRVVVQVIDAKTGTVVRSVPPEDLAKSLRNLAEPRGVLHDSET